MVFTSWLAHVQVSSYLFARKMVAKNYLMRRVLELEMLHFRECYRVWVLLSTPDDSLCSLRSRIRLPLRAPTPQRVSAIIFVIVLGFTLSLAQKPTTPGQKPARKDTPKYDLSNEGKTKGIVLEVQEFNCPVTGGTDAHLVLKLPEDKTVLVHLAPPRFLKEYGFSFAKDDQIEIIGSNARIVEEESILARKIERGDDAFTFRDQSGKPLW